MHTRKVCYQTYEAVCDVGLMGTTLQSTYNGTAHDTTFALGCIDLALLHHAVWTAMVQVCHAHITL